MQAERSSNGQNIEYFGGGGAACGAISRAVNQSSRPGPRRADPEFADIPVNDR